MSDRPDTEEARKDALIAELVDALQGIIGIVEKAGLLNLSRGVQLGQTSWYVKATDRLDYGRIVLSKAKRETGQ
ncbi:MAG: hypothetical protein ACE37E_01070 [Hyphomicrobiales bacterium]